MASNNSNTSSQQNQGSGQSSTLSEQISSTASAAGSTTQEYLDKGIQYIQQATGQAPSSSTTTTSSSQLGTAEGGGNATSVEKAVDNAHPDQIGDFIRDKHKSDSSGILKAQDAAELDRKVGAETE